MDEVQILRCDIPRELYERQIKELIEHLLKIDEEMQKSQNHGKSEKAVYQKKAVA